MIESGTDNRSPMGVQGDESPGIPRTVQWALAALLATGWVLMFAYKLHWMRHGGWQFDDSYMFYRYAMRVREGLGWSWNLDGAHTYGMTSLLWSWIVLLFSFVPGWVPMKLTLSSWLFSGLAIGTTALAVRWNARSNAMRGWGFTLPLVGLSFLTLTMFDNAALSGMETMLSLALMGLFTGMVLAQKTRAIRPEWLGLVAVLLYTARPESLLAAVLMLVLARVLLPGVTTRDVLRSLAVIAVGLAVVLLAGKLYFGSPLPLPFYLKSGHAYVGYRYRWYPVTLGLEALKGSAFYLVLLVALLRRSMLRRAAVTILPLLAVALYLCTVTQIMGFHSRYSVPYIPLLAVPAFLALDDAFLRSETRPQWTIVRVLSAMVLTGFLAGLLPMPVQQMLESKAERHVLAYNDVTFDAPAKTAPQLGYFPSMDAMDELASVLPNGATIASTEVGRLGADNLQLNIIDLAGLNDREIALHGFSVTYLLQRAPDVVWLPHTDYTWHRGVLLTDARFLAQYDIYAGVFDSGVAVRKGSPYRALAENKLAAMWPKLYPGTAPEEFLAHGVTWKPGTSVPPVWPPVL